VTTAAAQQAGLAGRNGTGLLFTAEMYGLQLDQLAELQGGTMRQARALAGRWASAGLADRAVLSPGIEVRVLQAAAYLPARAPA
jgi:hypothetical protein